ncbi:MAG: hypothetical protein BroJett011_64320 [Chloroflexota bacterium]|nr:MAG: hypothetical protein BroJett011_64320 [Chloroflexota bacterium]
MADKLTNKNTIQKLNGVQKQSLEPQRVYVIGCQVLQRALQSLLNNVPGLATCQFLDYGLHTVPAQMTTQIQNAIDSTNEPGIVLIGYGLCGNGLVGLQARQHTLVIPRTDDCIAILMGSYRRFLEDFQHYPGTYYLSEGWLESGHHPIAQLEDWSVSYGPEKAKKLITRMYKHYRRVVLVAFSPEELDRYRHQAQEVAKLLRVTYAEMVGEPTLLERLVWRVNTLNVDDQEFVVVPPGGTTTQASFIR